MVENSLISKNRSGRLKETILCWDTRVDKNDWPGDVDSYGMKFIHLIHMVGKKNGITFIWLDITE